MTIYSPQHTEEVLRQIYNDNCVKLLKSKKIAKYLSKLADPMSIEVAMETDLYSPKFKVFYFFQYTQYDKFNTWLTSMCKDHPIDGKTTGRIDDQHFVFDDDFNGEHIKIEVFGRYEQQI
jgi:hypothetical protein